MEVGCGVENRRRGPSLRLTSPVRGRVLQDQTLGTRDPSCSSFRRPTFPTFCRIVDPCDGGGDIPDCDRRSIFPLDRPRRVILICARQVGIRVFFGGSERVEVGRDGGGGFV